MKRVRALDKETGEFVRELHAAELSSERRYAFHYACLDPVCSQSYHWRKSYRMDGNKIQIPATFVENRSSEHKGGCRYDFAKIAAGHRDVAFYQDGAFHLKINFPMGAAHSDLSVPYARIEPERLRRRDHASDHVSMMGLSTLDAVVKFLEKEFGSIEANQTDILKLHYQGQDFDWNTVFAASDHYEKIINVPQEAAQKLTQSRLSVVRLSHEIEANAKGKARFACEAQDTRISGRLQRVQPILVSGSSHLSMMFREMADQRSTALIASRPFRPAAVDQHGFIPRKATPVSLYAASTDQVSIISDQYWRLRPGVQLKLDID